ncbi:hypothetical protein BLA29_001981 [Euroglyphus maynei]|uniref:Uncharacterized protein n=1 Tax=Euroglyphus maynei TaxID=6958 RepID=A0A1Y3BNG3_EURMA|nr:hypothetical protein BLA29_001981 [Euroglyphus maynei]
MSICSIEGQLAPSSLYPMNHVRMYVGDWCRAGTITACFILSALVVTEPIGHLLAVNGIKPIKITGVVADDGHMVMTPRQRDRLTNWCDDAR